MPIYDFQHPDGRIISISQKMSDEHFWIDEDGLKWNRIFTKPNAIIDSIYSINPHDKRKFVERTGKHKGKLGDIMQLSAELSERRADKDGGIDSIKEKNMNNYEKTRPGTIHPLRKQKQMREKLNKLGVDIE